MKLIAAILLLSSLCAMAEAPKRSGHATAQWIAPEGAVEAGLSLKTVIRLPAARLSRGMATTVPLRNSPWPWS